MILWSKDESGCYIQHELSDGFLLHFYYIEECIFEPFRVDTSNLDLIDHEIAKTLTPDNFKQIFDQFKSKHN